MHRYWNVNERFHRTLDCQNLQHSQTGRLTFRFFRRNWKVKFKLFIQKISLQFLWKVFLSSLNWLWVGLFLLWQKDSERLSLFQVLPPWKAAKSGSISFKIRTNEPNGLVMYSRSGALTRVSAYMLYLYSFPFT